MQILRTNKPLLMKVNDAKFGSPLLLAEPNITGIHTSKER